MRFGASTVNDRDYIALYGTDEPPRPPIELRAGALTAELDAGNLRHIRLGPVEVIRAISFITRDRNWGTYTPLIEGLEIDRGADTFSVRFLATVKDDVQSFRYRATINAREDAIEFIVSGAAESAFETNRTGFVVLHRAGIAGQAVSIEHVDGSVEQGRFPELIDPVQPMMDLRALTHEAAPGLRVTCRMEGDAYEMEDQRNWCDASYKTYVRPLSRPWPYSLAQGETLRQSVSLALNGPVPPASAGGDTVDIEIGDVVGPAPALGLGLDPSEIDATLRVLPRLIELRPHMLVCHFDSRRGHDRATLEAELNIANALGAEPWLEAVIADVDGFGAEMAALGALVRSLGSPFRSVLLSPAADLKSTSPGQAWPPAPPPGEFYRAARQSFPGVRLGGGMISSFTELNRKRPPLDNIDFVSFTTMALVHASDDVSVMEGLEALPSIARSARSIAGSLPVVVGPSAIGLRLNPYGAGPVPNPTNRRLAMALNDPRQRGQFGAAWAMVHFARLAKAGVEAIAYGGTTGPFGVVHTKQAWPTPGFASEGTPYPIFHALSHLAHLKGKSLRALAISAPEYLEGLAVEGASGTEVLLANVTAHPRRVRFGNVVETLGPYETIKFPKGATG